MSPPFPEGNVLFNDTLNTFCLRLYGVGYMVNEHTDSIKQQGLFYMQHRTDRIAPYTIFLYQLQSTGWNENWLNGSTMID